MSVYKSKALRKQRPPEYFLPRDGETPIKVWAMTISEREGISLASIWNRIKRGKYPNIVIRRVTGKVVFVKEQTV
jgi:hypothetical protein